MVVKLVCTKVEVRENPADSSWRPGETIKTAIFLDEDVEHGLVAFLKYSDEGAGKVKPGGIYNFAMTGLSPVKDDKSSYYLRGEVIGESK